MRNTKQRELVFDIVIKNDEHLTATQIYEEAKKIYSNISLGTIYRNLNNLVASGEIVRLKMPNKVDRYDNNIIHSHVICNKCGKIDDVFINYIKESPKIENYEVIGYDLRFNGICSECLKEEKVNGIKRKQNRS